MMIKIVLFCLLVVGMVHPDVVNKATASMDGDPEHLQLDVVHVDIGKEFTNKHEFTLREHVLQ